MHDAVSIYAFRLHDKLLYCGSRVYLQQPSMARWHQSDEAAIASSCSMCSKPRTTRALQSLLSEISQHRQQQASQLSVAPKSHRAAVTACERRRVLWHGTVMGARWYIHCKLHSDLQSDLGYIACLRRVLQVHASGKQPGTILSQLCRTVESLQADNRGKWTATATSHRRIQVICELVSRHQPSSRYTPSAAMYMWVTGRYM